MAIYTKVFNDKESYQGYILDGLYHGKGIIKYLNDTMFVSYDGDWLDGKFNGSGKIIYINEQIYIGQVKNSSRHGYGKMYSANGKYLYDGIWDDDHIEKSTYIEQYDKDSKILYCGFRFNDKLNGWNILFNELKTVIYKIVLFKDNKIMKQIEFTKTNIICNYEPKIETIDIKSFMNKILMGLTQYFFDETNLEILDKLSYDIENGKIKEYTNYMILDNEYNCIDIGIYNDVLSDDLINKIKTKIFGEMPKKILTNYKIIDKYLMVGLCIRNAFFNTIKYIRPPSFKTINDINIFNNITKFEEGNFIYTMGNTYELQDEGIRYVSENVRLEGIFYMGQITKGNEYKNNIMVYEGEYKNNRYELKGKLYYGNGFVQYDGQFSNGKKHGLGSSFYINGLVEYTGLWSNGVKQGHGRLYSNGGDEIYSGNFDNDQIS